MVSSIFSTLIGILFFKTIFIFIEIYGKDLINNDNLKLKEEFVKMNETLEKEIKF